MMHYSSLKHYYLRVLICVSCLVTLSAEAASLTSTVNRNQLASNQTLVLTVVYDDQVDSSSLDVAALTQSFDVLGVSPQTSTSMSIVNGVTENNSTTRWSITLAPKREGELQIPSFSIGAAKSQPISISVSDAASRASSSASEPLAVSVVVEPTDVYAEQQFILKVQLVVTQNLSDLGGSQLSIDGGDIRPLGQQTYQQVDNGIATQVVELRYAVFPQQPGTLTIPALRYTGVIGGRRSVFDSFGMRGEQVIARSQPVSIEVKPRQQKTGSEWLPASNLSLQATWSSDISQLSVGQPVTRTITMTAEHQRSELIPPLTTSSNIGDFKSYQDQPQLNDEVTEQGIIGTRIESQAIVASKAGELRLPEVRVPWWNTQSEQWEEAVLAEQVLMIAADSTVDINAGEDDANVSQDNASDPNHGTQSESEVPFSNPILLAVLSLLALIIALQSFVIYRLNRQLTSIRDNPMSALEEQDLSAEEAWSVVLDQLKKEDPSGTRIALTQWLRIAMNADHDTPLSSLMVRLDDAALSAEVERLDRTLYQQGDGFSPRQLAEAALAVRERLLNQAQGGPESDLPPLYPS